MKFVLGGDEPVSPQDRAEIDQRQQRIRQEADPGILARIHRIEQHPMVPRPRELPRALRGMSTHFDDPLRQWHVGFLAVNDFEIPYEMARDLKECVPQSILRDIFRPTTNFEFMLEPLEIEKDRTGAEAMKEAKAALLRDPVPVIESGVSAVTREQRRRRRFVGRPWQTMIADDQPRQYSRVEGISYREVSEDGSPLEEGDEDGEEE